MYVTPSVVKIHLDLYMHMELIYRRKCANSLSPVKDKQAIRYFSPQNRAQTVAHTDSV